VPGAVDAWYILLDRWGTMSFAQVLSEAIDLAEKRISNWRFHGSRHRRFAEA